jgi:hypothetical protein
VRQTWEVEEVDSWALDVRIGGLRRVGAAVVRGG